MLLALPLSHTSTARVRVGLFVKENHLLPVARFLVQVEKCHKMTNFIRWTMCKQHQLHCHVECAHNHSSYDVSKLS